jgi:hypothetical protein
MSALYDSDTFPVLREHVKEESVVLIFLRTK